MYNIFDGANVYRKYFYLEPLPEHLENTLRGFNAQPNTIWVFDGFNSRKNRVDLFPEYKGKRKPPSPDDLAMFEMMREFKEVTLPSWGAVVLEFPEWEADDIIYNLVKFLKVSQVYSTDIDFWQMLKANPELLLPETNKPKCAIEDIVVYKTLVGDTSDNISGLKGFGQGAWDKLDDFDKEKISFFLQDQSQFPPTNISDSKLQFKLDEHWDTLKIYHKLVSFIELSDVEFKDMILAKLT